MKSIAIDATHFSTANATGVEGYVANLLPELSRLLIKGRVQVTWIGTTAEAPNGMPEQVRWLSVPYKRFWSQTALAEALGKEQPDLFFTPSGVAPLRYTGALAMTVHDMSAYIAPEAYTLGQRFRLRWLMGRNAAHASCIVAPSQYTANEVAHWWQIDPSVIMVTPLGYAHSTVKGEPLADLDPKKGFFLFTGRLEHKKNLVPVVQGFAKLTEYPEMHLVLAGKKGYGFKRLEKTVADLPEQLRQRILLPGYISEAQKEWLMDNATALIVPSPYEGFGLPVLEGFAHEKPVLCAQAGALPEVAGNAGVYVQSDSPIDWYLQMKKIMSEPDLFKPLVQEGSRRAKEFSWKRTAELTAERFLSL